MLAFARVGVLVEGGAVEKRQAVRVFGKVAGHPIDDDAEPGLMAGVDEVHEVVGRAEARGGGVIANHLIAPRAGERMLGHREQFDVRVAEARAVFHQARRKFAIAEVGIVRAAQPGAEMDFVDGDRLFEDVFVAARFHPAVIAPLVASCIPHDGSGLGRDFAREAVGIGLLLAVGVLARAHGVFVVGSDADAGDEQFPDAAGAKTHGMTALIPIVEIADHAHHFGVRRPDRESHAGNVVTGNRMRAHGAIAFVLRAFAVNMQIEVGDQGAEAVGVVDLDAAAIPEREAQLVTIRLAIERRDENSFGAQLLHGVCGVADDHFRVHGLGKKGSHFPGVAAAMRSQ